MPDSYTGLPTVEPSGGGGAYQNINVPRINAEMTGGAAARGLEEGGASLKRTGDLFGEVAADNAANEYQERINRILHGDPAKMTTGPDGQPTPDLGYLGTKGAKALEDRRGVAQQMEDLRKEIRGGMKTLPQQMRFDSFSRRYKTYAEGQIGTHADNQANQWYTNVNKASENLALQHIADNPDDPNAVLQGYGDLANARIKQAQLMGGGPELLKQAESSARRDALLAQVSAIGVKDPARAMRILEKNKGIAGLHYDEAANKIRPRAEQQEGRQTADWLLTGAPPPKGDDAAAVLRHFEGFRERPYTDNDGKLRAGYGSDTVTRADGSVAPVSADTVVSREDAERDLGRRTAATQGAIRQSIGDDAWQGLTPQARASLTSVAYNYGTLPESVAAAARGDDPAALATAVRDLAKHNGGINAGRRHSEANNIARQDGVTTEPRTQSDMLEEVRRMHLEPQAEAAAMARINQSFAHRTDSEVRQRAAFESKVKDQSALALNTGETPDPIGEPEFTRHYGETLGPEKYQAYISDVKFGADYKALQGMSDAEQERLLNSRLTGIDPAKPGYAHALANVDRLRKGIAGLQKERRDDPAAAVGRMPAVMDALKTYDEKKPESFALVAAARLQAQEAMGIEDDYRSPITKAEALKLTTPLATSIPGQEAKALAQIGQTFDKMFGAEAPRALAYAVRARHVNAEVGRDAAAVILKLSRGEGLTRSDARRVDTSRADAAERNALRPRPPGSAQQVLRQIGNPENDMTTEPSTLGDKPVPNTEAIRYLRANPQTAPVFDKTFGTGLSQEILKKYPAGAP